MEANKNKKTNWQIIKNQLEAEIQELTYELRNGWHRGSEDAIRARIQLLFNQIPPDPPRPHSYPRKCRRKSAAQQAGAVTSYSGYELWLLTEQSYALTRRLEHHNKQTVCALTASLG